VEIPITMNIGMTSVDDSGPIAVDYSIEQNYPNPFNASTSIHYNLPRASHVKIDIYDILGRKVETLVNETQPAGEHNVIWNSDDNPSGTYFYRIQAGDFVEVNKMVLLK
jgi:flagellar hook assembly protein FlgD